MKINEIIKTKRLEKNMTQQQVALALGVSTPAVNKWENGICYPDITLLPALARLLQTDLNTLLSFKDDLNDQEIAIFLNELTLNSETMNFDQIYKQATAKISEYPTCYRLILQIAMLLDGILITKTKHYKQYQTKIEELYQQLTTCQDLKIKTQAQSMLISKYINKQEYQKANTLLQSIPEPHYVDKKQIRIKLLLAQKNYFEASKLAQENLLQTINKTQNILLTLLDIALKQKKNEDASYIANIYKKNSDLFDLWPYNRYLADFIFYSANKNKDKSISTLISLLNALTDNYTLNNSPLYHHLKTKQIDDNFSNKMQTMIIESIINDKNTAFLKDTPEFQKLVNKTISK